MEFLFYRPAKRSFRLGFRRSESARDDDALRTTRYLAVRRIGGDHFAEEETTHVNLSAGRRKAVMGRGLEELEGFHGDPIRIRQSASVLHLRDRCALGRACRNTLWRDL